MKRSRSAAGRLAAGAAVLMAVTFAGPAAVATASGKTQPGLPSGDITTIAGGLGGPGPATSVSLEQLYGCFGMQVARGGLYLNGTGAERVVNVRTGALTTVARQLLPVFFSAPALLLRQSPCSADLDSYGNLVVADHGVQVQAAKSGTFYGQKMIKGHFYRVMQASDCFDIVHQLACAVDVTVDRWGNLVASFSASHGRFHPKPAAVNVAPARSGTYYGVRMKVGNTYRLVSGGGAQVAPDRAGNLLVAGDGPNRVGVIAGTSGRFYGRKMTAGKLYNIAGTRTGGFSGDGHAAVKARLSGPMGVAVDGAGNVVIADTGNGRVRVVAGRTGRFYGRQMKAGDIYTVIANAAPEISRNPASVVAVAVDGAGNLLTLTVNASNQFLTEDGPVVRALATRSGRFYGQQMRAGHRYIVAGVVSGAPGDGGPATAAQLQDLGGWSDIGAGGLAVDSAGNLLMTSACRVRVVAAKSGTFYGQQMTAGDIYSIAGDGSQEFSGDGKPALQTGMCPGDIKLDGSGNLVLADGGRVRVIAASSGTFYGQAMTAGDVYTVAGDGQEGFTGDGGPAVDASLGPVGIAVDAAGNLVIADIENQRVRVVATQTGTFYGQSMVAGDIYTIAGAGNNGNDGDGVPATEAEIQDPIEVTTDTNGNVLFSEDFVLKLIRVIAVSTGTFYGQQMTAGDIYSIAGRGGGSDGGPAATAFLKNTGALAFDPDGNLILADPRDGHGRFQVIAGSTGTFYGQQMTAGDIYTLAGGGNNGLGDGGPGTSAEIDPGGIAVFPNGDLALGDPGDGRIRLMSH